MGCVDPHLIARLASGEGWGLLQSLPPYDESEALTLAGRLRSDGFDAELVAAALTQSQWRAKARAKFGASADRMLFTFDGVEQATDPRIAARRASRYAAAGVTEVHDLGCGIGSDAAAFAAAELNVWAYDRDPTTAAIAAVNLRPWRTARVEVGDAEQVSSVLRFRRTQGEQFGVFGDPARRTPGIADITGRTRRTFSLDALSPRWDLIQELADHVPHSAAKLSPSFAHTGIPSGCEAEWVSVGGEVKETCVWWPGLALHPGRTASVGLASGDFATVTAAQARAGAERPTLPAYQQGGPWLYEPDKAVIRAGLVGALVAEVDGYEVGPGIGYVTSEHARDVPWAKRYRVLEAMPFSIKGTRAWLRDHGHSSAIIKKRGVSLDDEQLRRQLRLSRGGTDPATLVITRVAGQQVCLVVQPG